MNDTANKVLRNALREAREDLDAARKHSVGISRDLAQAEKRVAACEKYVAELVAAVGGES